METKFSTGTKGESIGNLWIAQGACSGTWYVMLGKKELARRKTRAAALIAMIRASRGEPVEPE